MGNSRSERHLRACSWTRRATSSGASSHPRSTAYPFHKVRGAERIIGPADDWRVLGTDQDPLEHLATTDAMIISTRRKLIHAARDFVERGIVPPGVDNPDVYRMRSGGALLPAGLDGLEVLRPVHYFESDSPALEAIAETPA
jgi:hypothetical protein